MRLFLFLFLLTGTFYTYGQKSSFTEEHHPAAPDYSKTLSWSALPFKEDRSDVVPKGEKWIEDSLKAVDVFYVHPTMYQKGLRWNASLDMKQINRKVDNYPVKLQASVFNESCRVYAPRYRQAVVKVFYESSTDGDSALNLAYQDVKRAFQYYIDNYNQGRPFIIAGHSQGTHHTRRLLQELIDTTALLKQMVAAYIIGFQVNDSMYQNTKMCSLPDETGCYISWMSYREGYEPNGEWFKNTQSINPLTWTMHSDRVTVEEYSGSVVLNLNRKFKRRMSVRIADVGGKVLWVETKAPWFRNWKNLHVADYGLFYHTIRENVKLRIKAYLNNQK